jgi:calcium-binding protein CML
MRHMPPPCVQVIYLLDGITKRRTITSPEARKCLQLVEQSFMFFDSTADGCIERKELAYALKSGTKVR